MVGKKSWREKLLDNHGLPKVVRITERQAKRWGKGTIAIPAPREVDGVMRKVPRGKLITINQIRGILARKHGATICCPIVSGIFSCIAARAAEEAREAGETDVTPYWRTLKTGGILNEKYPGGVEAQATKLRREGHKIIKKGKKVIAADFEKRLVGL